MRHGHKSHSTRFDGHKASVAAEAEENPITDVDVIAANAPDNALELVGTSEAPEVQRCQAHSRGEGPAPTRRPVVNLLCPSHDAHSACAKAAPA